jgi:hypothetical protein
MDGPLLPRLSSLRRPVLIGLAVVATAGLVFGANVWIQHRRASAERDERVAKANELKESEEG